MIFLWLIISWTGVLIIWIGHGGLKSAIEGSTVMLIGMWISVEYAYWRDRKRRR